MKKLYFILGLLLFVLTGCNSYENQPVNEETTSIQTDFSKEFNGVNGCAVFYSLADDKYTYYNKDMCSNEYSPYSTYKIVCAAAALKNGVVTSPEDKMKYSGDIYPFDTWNKDLSFKEAFQTSCVWYFRQLTDKVGAENIQNILDELDYGNKDISQWQGNGEQEQADLNGFWLGSSLKISPECQVEVLKKIFNGNSSISEKNISILKDIMLVENSENMKIYGKTGTGKNCGWFVGFSEQCGYIDYFAIYMNNGVDKMIAGADAKATAINIINNHFKR